MYATADRYLDDLRSRHAELSERNAVLQRRVGTSGENRHHHHHHYHHRGVRYIIEYECTSHIGIQSCSHKPRFACRFAWYTLCMSWSCLIQDCV